MEAQTIPAEAPPEPRTADMPVTFMSRRRDLYLVVVPGREAIDALHRTYTVRGTHIEFAEGKFTTDDLDTIEWLRAHQRFNDISDGFFEIEPEVPLPEGELLDLAQAGAALNDELVREVLERELAGWKRDIVIRTAEATLDAIAQQRASAGEEGEGLAEAERARQEAEERAQAAEARAQAAEQRAAELEQPPPAEGGQE